MGLWTRARDGHDTSQLVHHSDRGTQYVAIRYTERLAEAGAVASVGSRGDSYDNAMAESVNGEYKTELMWRRKPFADLSELELTTFRWVSWWNSKRLHRLLGYRTPERTETEFMQTKRRKPPHYKGGTKIRPYHLCKKIKGDWCELLFCYDVPLARFNIR